ncbi:MAG: NTP transferase domain-containing protein [Colwellia sp.]
MTSKLTSAKLSAPKLAFSTATTLDLDCIMPAAGLSSRMGEWKIMLPYKDSTILETSVKNALSVCSRVILVAGHRATELIDKMHGYPDVEIVINENYHQGMFSSIQQGLNHVRSDYFFIAHADMPCISPELYRNLWQARAQGSVFLGDKSRSGHPVLIDSALKDAILKQADSASMKAILRRFSMTYLKLADTAIHFDIDTPADYEKLCAEYPHLGD